MTYEKSCGALVIHFDKEGVAHVLMIKHVSGGHRSFPKGHVEAGETEHMTAEREVMEETSIRIHIHEKFRHSVFYSPRVGVKKEVVYFLAYSKYTNAKNHKAKQSDFTEIVSLFKKIKRIIFFGNRK